jgi:hypothetical protein
MTYMTELKAIENKLKEVGVVLNGDGSLAKREFETVSGMLGFVEAIVSGTWSQSLGLTDTYNEKLNELKPQFKVLYNDVVELNNKLVSLENKLDDLKLPSTPGRLPKYTGQ